MMDFSAWLIGIGIFTFTWLIYFKLDGILDELKKANGARVGVGEKKNG